MQSWSTRGGFGGKGGERKVAPVLLILLFGSFTLLWDKEGSPCDALLMALAEELVGVQALFSLCYFTPVNILLGKERQVKTLKVSGAEDLPMEVSHPVYQQGSSCSFNLGLRMKTRGTEWARSPPGPASLKLRTKHCSWSLAGLQSALKSVRTNAHVVCYWFCSCLSSSSRRLIMTRSTAPPGQHSLMSPISGLEETCTLP